MCIRDRISLDGALAATHEDVRGIPGHFEATVHAIRALSGRLEALMGPAIGRPRAQTASTRDGKGILFVAHDGEVNPAGFLPQPLGNVRDLSVAQIYRDDPLLRRIRAADFTGRCGRCEYADLCGGSRARAFAASGDALGEDPACPYEPGDSPGPATLVGA